MIEISGWSLGLNFIRTTVTSLFFSCLLGLAAPVSAQTELLMVEEKWCPWCEQWNQEIGKVYPRTVEGALAPLRRLDAHGSVPDGLRLKSGIHFTPTFVLLVDGQEVGRIEGYPGEDFFWALLGELLNALPAENKQAVTQTPDHALVAEG